MTTLAGGEDPALVFLSLVDRCLRATLSCSDADSSLPEGVGRGRLWIEELFIELSLRGSRLANSSRSSSMLGSSACDLASAAKLAFEDFERRLGKDGIRRIDLFFLIRGMCTANAEGALDTEGMELDDPEDEPVENVGMMGLVGIAPAFANGIEVLDIIDPPVAEDMDEDEEPEPEPESLEKSEDDMVEVREALGMITEPASMASTDARLNSGTDLCASEMSLRAAARDIQSRPRSSICEG